HEASNALVAVDPKLSAPSLDFGEARPAVERVVYLDANAIGAVRSKVHCALDQIVARYAGKVHPGGTIPTVHREIDYAKTGEGEAVGRLHRIGIIVLHGIHNHPIDRLCAIEVDLHP